MSGTYTVTVVCANCRKQQRLEITKGVRVDRKSCPDCGIAALAVVRGRQLGEVA